LDAPIYSLSLNFAVRIVRLCQYLTEEKRAYILSKQLMRSGTSIGANLREAKFAQSKKDFTAKCTIALKEAGETQYWLELLHQTELLSEKEYQSISADCNELVAILVSTVKSSKSKPE
jgi:four helix bundle protein